MRTDDSEAAYLQKRIDASEAMATAATDECAQMAHKSLANLYAHKLKALLRAMDPPRHRQDRKSSIDRDRPREASKIHGTLRLLCPA